MELAETPTWRKSSFSYANGNCAEAGSWRKSSFSYANGNCLEAGTGDAIVGIRDTQEASHPYRVTLEVPAGAWQRFITDIKDGIHP